MCAVVLAVALIRQPASVSAASVLRNNSSRLPAVVMQTSRWGLHCLSVSAAFCYLRLRVRYLSGVLLAGPIVDRKSIELTGPLGILDDVECGDILASRAIYVDAQSGARVSVESDVILAFGQTLGIRPQRRRPQISDFGHLERVSARDSAAGSAFVVDPERQIISTGDLPHEIFIGCSLIERLNCRLVVIGTSAIGLFRCLNADGVEVVFICQDCCGRIGFQAGPKPSLALSIHLDAAILSADLEPRARSAKHHRPFAFCDRPAHQASDFVGDLDRDSDDFPALEGIRPSNARLAVAEVFLKTDGESSGILERLFHAHFGDAVEEVIPQQLVSLS